MAGKGKGKKVSKALVVVTPRKSLNAEIRAAAGKPKRKRSARAGKSTALAKGTPRRAIVDRLTARIYISTKGVWKMTTSSSTESIQVVPLNACDSRVTGQASRVIAGYESWKVRRAWIIYEPTCAATQAGTVAVRFDPDPDDPPPATLEQFISSGLAAYGPMWQPMKLSLPSSVMNKLKEYFVDPTAGAGAKSMSRMSCPGQLQFYLSQDTAAVSVGIFSLHMDIECNTLSEAPPTASVTITDASPTQNGANWISSAASYIRAGLPGVFGAGLFTDAPNNVRHIEAMQPGIYQVFCEWVGTNLASPTLAALAGETLSGISFTINQAIVNSTSTIATLAATIVVNEVFSNSYNGTKHSFLDILPTLGGISTITSARLFSAFHAKI